MRRHVRLVIAAAVINGILVVATIACLLLLLRAEHATERAERAKASASAATHQAELARDAARSHALVLTAREALARGKVTSAAMLAREAARLSTSKAAIATLRDALSRLPDSAASGEPLPETSPELLSAADARLAAFPLPSPEEIGDLEFLGSQRVGNYVITVRGLRRAGEMAFDLPGGVIGDVPVTVRPPPGQEILFLTLHALAMEGAHAPLVCDRAFVLDEAGARHDAMETWFQVRPDRREYDVHVNLPIGTRVRSFSLSGANWSLAHLEP